MTFRMRPTLALILMWPVGFSLTLNAFSLGCKPETALRRSGQAGLQVGAVSGGYAWTTLSSDIGPPFTVLFTQLTKEELPGSRQVCWDFSRRDIDPPWCWRIGNGAFWILEFSGAPGGGGRPPSPLLRRMPLDVLVTLRDPKGKAIIITKEERAKGRPWDLEFSHYGRFYYPFMQDAPGLNPSIVIKGDSGRTPYDPTRPSVSCDIIPLAKESMLSFYRVIQPQGRRQGEQPMEVWETRDFKIPWTKKEEFPCHIEEHFRGYVGSDGTYYFVTESGKVYMAPMVAPGIRRLEPLWTDKWKPIHAVIEDVDRGKTFVFGGEPGRRLAENEEKRFFYFELQKKPVVKEFVSKDVPVVEGPSAAQTVFAYARMLKDKGE